MPICPRPRRQFPSLAVDDAQVWPGTARPIAPGRTGNSPAQDEATRLHSVWP